MKVMFDEEAALRSHDNEIREEAREEARKAREEGIRALVESLHELSQARGLVIQIVARKFDLQPQAAADKVSLYWQ